jgi:hypothetical protein
MVNQKLESSFKGAIGENIVIGEFLKRGFDVYLPIVDQGIDCIIRTDNRNFFEIQIKTRHTDKKAGKYWFEVRNLKVRPNFFIVLYQAKLFPEDFWVIPSAVFKQHCRPKKEVCVLQLNPKRQGELRKYKNNFNQFT